MISLFYLFILYRFHGLMKNTFFIRLLSVYSVIYVCYFNPIVSKQLHESLRTI